MTDVRMPDGTVVTNVPDGITKAEMMRRLGLAPETREDRIAALVASNPAEYDPSSPEFQQKYSPAEGFLKNFDIGVGKIFTDLGLGARQLLAMRVPGTQIDEKLKAEAAEKRRIDAPLMGTVGGKAGAITGGIATTLPALAIPGAATLPGAALTGAAFGAAQPSESGKGRLLNTALGGGLGLAGQYGGQKLAGFASRKLAERAARSDASKVARQPLNSLIEESRAKGLVIPPSTANPSLVNRTAEGLAGKLTTGQGASVYNQQTFNNLAKRAIGIPDDVPLSRQSVAEVRENAGKVYADIAETADIAADQKFLDEILSLPEEITAVAKDFPDLPLEGAKQVQELAEGLFRDKFSARSAIEVVKRLRNQSSTHFKSMDDPAKRALAFAERRAADAVDDLIVRHLQSTGQASLANQYNAARRLIAQTYTVDAALNEAGNIAAKQIAQQLSRGRPLSGDLGLIGRFAEAFPKAARETTESFPGFSPLDYGFSGLVGGGALAGGSPEALAIAALPALRAITRRGILSGPAQNAMLTPATRPGLPGTAGLTLLDLIGKRAAPASIAAGSVVQPIQQ